MVCHSSEHTYEEQDERNLQKEECGAKNGQNKLDVESRLLELFDVERYPHIVENIFYNLDSTSLRKCRILCRRLKDIVDSFILGNPQVVEELRLRWMQGNCSRYPVTPTSDLADEYNPESKYRNVLTVKADTSEILIALDNGNVEIYDRENLNLTYTIVGKFSISPTVLDITDDIILVGYTASTFGKHRIVNSSAGTGSGMPTIAPGTHMRNGRKGPAPPQNTWWKIFCRQTKQHLRTIEKTQATRLASAAAASAAQQNALVKERCSLPKEDIHSTTATTNQEHELLLPTIVSSDSKIPSTHNNFEDTSCYDYSYSEARLGPDNFIYFHSRRNILSVAVNFRDSKSHYSDSKKSPKPKSCHDASSTSSNGDCSSVGLQQDDEDPKSNMSFTIPGQVHSGGGISVQRIASIANMKGSTIRAFDLDQNLITVGIKETTFSPANQSAETENNAYSNFLCVYRHVGSDTNYASEISGQNYSKNVEMTSQKISPSPRQYYSKFESLRNNPVLKIPLLSGYTPPTSGERRDSDFSENKCCIDRLQLLYPLCLVQLSNNGGSFEHVSSLGQPYVCFVFADIVRGTSLKILTLDQHWMRLRSASGNFVPYDSDTSVLAAKFNCSHLVVGFGSFSARNDGCIAIWEISDLLEIKDDLGAAMVDYSSKDGPTKDSDHNGVYSTIVANGTHLNDYDILVHMLDPPTFHWSGWDDHCGGVNVLELDRYAYRAYIS